MSGHDRKSIVSLDVKKDSSVEICSGSESISVALLTLSSAPAILSLIGLFIAYHLKLFALVIFLAFLSIFGAAFFITIAAVHLQTRQRIKVNNDGVKEVRYTIFGPQSIFFKNSEIACLKAIIEGWDQVQLCLQMISNTRKTLFTVPIDSLDEFLEEMSRHLRKSYLVTVQCTRVFSPPPLDTIDKPDFISFDVKSRTLRCDMPDNRQIELPFFQIDSIDTLGQRYTDGSTLDEDSTAVEYVCEPIICMKDDSVYVLQRFLSKESSYTKTSNAFVSASKTAEYLKRCIEQG